MSERDNHRAVAQHSTCVTVARGCSCHQQSKAISARAGWYHNGGPMEWLRQLQGVQLSENHKEVYKSSKVSKHLKIAYARAISKLMCNCLTLVSNSTLYFKLILCFIFRTLLIILMRYDKHGHKLETPVDVCPYLSLDKYISSDCRPPPPPM